MTQAERAVKAKKRTAGETSDLQLEAEPENDVFPSEMDSDAAQRAVRRANREEAIAAKKADKEAEREKQKEIAQIKQRNSRVNEYLGFEGTHCVDSSSGHASKYEEE